MKFKIIRLLIAQDKGQPERSLLADRTDRLLALKCSPSVRPSICDTVHCGLTMHPTASV